MEITVKAISNNVFYGRKAPESCLLVGYGAIICELKLNATVPHQLSLIHSKSKRDQTDQWQLFPGSYQPDDTLYKHLVFALKYEGVDLLVFKKLFDHLEKKEIQKLIEIDPMGQYSRKIWFLYEWLKEDELEAPADLSKRKYIPLLDEKLQFTIKGENSARHKIINNLPGTRNFCPLIRKTGKLEKYIQSDIRKQKSTYLDRIHRDVLQRASAYLLLKDSKASFTIEGEKPRSNKAARWGNAIGQAGENELDIQELNRLQQIVIESKRFTKFGIREQEGFVGDRDRATGEPLPDHISARYKDLPQLMEGLIATKNLLAQSEMDPVLVAAAIAFGFVFIHPYVDGNGRLHRYIVHHILTRMNYTQQGMIFPVSASILDHLPEYKTTLELYSHPVLAQIEWQPTSDNNIEILNNTIDYYRYFDATAQAEFLYYCVEDTITNIIPFEVDYLRKYDDFKQYLDDKYEMPDDTVALLVRFLEQGNGKLSKRARTKEFEELEDSEANEIENQFAIIFEIEE